MILEVKTQSDLDNLLMRLNRSVNKFNEQNKVPYKISLSTGYALFDAHSEISIEHFLNKIDKLMYEEKFKKQLL